MSRKKVLIDCDPGIDDALALLLAFASPELEVQAVTVVGGNQPLEATLQNALGLTRLLSAGVPVAAGAAGPLVQKLVTAPEVHGENGLAGRVFAKISTPSPLTALETMRQFVAGSPQPVVLIATGPLTNVALFLKIYPELKDNIEYISIMGGGAFLGNQKPGAEFNIYVDPEAAELVFAAGVPVVMHGLDVTTKAFFTAEDVQRIREIGTPLAKTVCEWLDYYMVFHRSMGLQVLNMHDLCAVQYVAKPELFTTNSCHVAVECRGSITRGCTVADFYHYTSLPHNALVAYEVRREEFVECFVKAVRHYG